ncbi:Ig-like domain-containing protein [Ramlibacter sp. AN1133]|uniref:Ig-like domain-containing protein n=1 Tax=Ramlibacter sp. AN1133 TaxID=3133429 RepID=UPI0030C49AB2
MKTKRSVIATAAALALLAAAPAQAVLTRMGPIDKSPTVGGYPAWFQDATGITMEFCDLKSQAELDGGWCVLIPPGPVFPEAFPGNYFDEHFYYIADNGLLDTATGFRARLVIALEAAFANGDVIDGDQMTFGRVRVFIPNLPIAGDYRVITPYSDTSYYNQVAGDRIFETTDVGVACINTFECTLGTVIGPFLLPSVAAGGAEVPPMPDLAARPAGTDPWFDAMVAAGAGPTANPGTGKKYLADPARVGTVTGSPLPPFTAFNTDGTSTLRDHNTFRIEVRHPQPDHLGTVLYTVDGESNFVVSGRLMTGTIPGEIVGARGTYHANALGQVTDLDAFATALPTADARLPASPPLAPVTPILQFYDVPCGGAISVSPVTGLPVVNPGPYTAPAGALAHPMASSATDYWGQSQPGGLPPSHLCIVDTTARNTAGQVVLAYFLQKVTDDVQISLSQYNGPNNGTLTVNAASTDPTAVLTLTGYGPAPLATPGTSVGRGAGTGLQLVAGAASVSALVAPPSRVQVVSNKGGADVRNTDAALGTAVLVGVPVANNDTVTINEDCSATAATSCATPVSIDLLANDTVQLNGVTSNLRTLVTSGQATVAVTVTQATRLGTATVSNGFVTYRPNANANGQDNLLYTVTVNGRVSNQGQLAINITPVNDLPVAGNTTIGAVVGKANVLNLLQASSDPDGAADLANAQITTWPAQLGAQPVPVNGVITYTPTSTGNFAINFRAVDKAGALSANTATATSTVIGSETITYTRQDFKGAGNVGGNASTRWTVIGTDTVREFQTVTIAYANGTIRATGQVCNGTATILACVVGTAVVDATGTWTYDVVGVPGGAKDPTDTAFWSATPTSIRTFSSSPVLGGAQTISIVFR